MQPETTILEFDLPGLGACFLPREFANFTGPLSSIEMKDASEQPRTVLALLVSGKAIVLSGQYPRVDGIYRYCAHNERLLATDESPEDGTADHRQRIANLTAACRMKLHHLLVPAKGDGLVGIEDAPDTMGLQQWLEQPTGEKVFLMPIRRLQRILTDIRRAKEGLTVPGLGAPITILPHVYVPSDMSVPSMLNEFAALITGKRVLDMGTGTGVLALLASSLGAASVVATDSNPKAVENTRINASRLGMNSTVEVRAPASLFDGLVNEVFDVIIFNAPWSEGIPESLYDTAIYDPGYRVMDGFMKAAPDHLTIGGAILLQYADVPGGVGKRSAEHLMSTLDDNGLLVASTRSIHRRSRLTGTGESVRIFEIRRKSEQRGA